MLPSIYEGLGIVGIEAQASGLPCLFSDRITREVDVTNGCEFLPVDNPAVWANALCALKPRTDAARAATDHTDFANYDIVRQGRWLTEKYIELAKKAGVNVT